MFNIKFVSVMHTQGSQEWLNWRDQGTGASEVVVLVDQCPYKTKHQLYLEKKGLIEVEDLNRNPNVLRGKRCESKIRDYLINNFNTPIEVLCGEDENHPHRKVSYDGVLLANFNNVVRPVPVEIKAPCKSVYNDVVENLEKSEAFLHHVWQLQYQMALLDSPYGYLVFYCEFSNRIKIFTVYPDYDMQKKAIDLVDEFHYSYIEKNIEPPLDPDRDVFVLGDDIKYQWNGMASELLRIKTRESELKLEMEKLKKESDKLSERLIQFTHGFKKVRVGNLQVTRVKARESFDYKGFMKDKDISITDDDLEKYSKKSKLSYRVSIYDKEQLKEKTESDKNKGYVTLATLENITRAVSLTL